MSALNVLCLRGYFLDGAIVRHVGKPTKALAVIDSGSDTEAAFRGAVVVLADRWHISKRALARREEHAAGGAP